MNSTINTFTSSVDRFASFLPNLLSGVVVLLVGWGIGFVLARLTRAILARIGYDRLLVKLGLVDRSRAEGHSGSRWAGTAVFVVVMLVAVMQAARSWNLSFVSGGIARFIAYIPHLIGAVVIFGGALYFANWIRDRMARAPSESLGARQNPVVASSVRGGILTLGAFMALRELQIAPEIVTIAFTVTLAAIALAGALAFGLGSRSVAGRMTEQWYERRAQSAQSGERSRTTDGTVSAGGEPRRSA
jgi:hypothetical protein